MNKQHVVLVFPACSTKVFASNESEGARQEKTIAPPLGILYLAAELINAGYRVTAIDYNAEEYSSEALTRSIADADIVGVSIMSFNRDNAAEVIGAINRLRPRLPVIAGGPDLMLHPRLIPGTRLSCTHEAEEIIVEIVRAVLAKTGLERVRGIMYPGPGGRVMPGAPYECIVDLDGVKFPRRELLRENKGYSVIGRKAGRNITTIITSRGCPKRCSFCAHGAIAYRRYRRRGAENVLAELREIAAMGFKIVGIVDDNFTADTARAAAILKGVRNLGLTMAVQGRVDADPKLFTLMRQAGVAVITFGLESGNQDTLDFYKKDATIEMNRRAIRLADRAGLYTGGLFIIGAPHEKLEHFEATYRFAASLPLDVTSFWVLDYTYGSELWKNAYAQGILRAEEFNVSAGSQRGTSPYTTSQLEQIAQKMFFRFYRRKSYWLRQAVKFARIRNGYFLRVLFAGAWWLLVRKIGVYGTSKRNSVRRLMKRSPIVGKLLYRRTAQSVEKELSNG